jgi:hypothetical protein
MRVAWFRALREPQLAVGATQASPLRVVDLFDDTAPLLAELASTHEIEVVDEGSAHDFVWKAFRRPYHVCMYELDDTARHHFIWPYLFHYPGLLWLRTLTVHESRAAILEHEQRIDDYVTEFRFNHGAPPALLPGPSRRVGRANWPMLRAPLTASKLVVVPHASTAASLRMEYPDARIRHVPTGMPNFVDPDQAGGAGSAPRSNEHSRTLMVGVPGVEHRDMMQRVMHHARAAGLDIELLDAAAPHGMLRRADVVLALDWPPAGRPLTPALAAMAAAKPVVVFETEVTADWPALDPQTWRPRGRQATEPIAISIDPRDEEHSLMLALRRLSADEALREQLGAAAQAWWRAHATVRQAADRWNQVLDEAASLTPPPRPADWPAHLTANGTELARKILAEFEQSVDFLR